MITKIKNRFFPPHYVVGYNAALRISDSSSTKQQGGLPPHELADRKNDRGRRVQNDREKTKSVLLDASRKTDGTYSKSMLLFETALFVAGREPL
jgi:hypothetical protein